MQKAKTAAPELRVDNGIMLRRLQASDGETLFELIDRNRAHLARYLPWPDQTLEVQNSGRSLSNARGSGPTAPARITAFLSTAPLPATSASWRSRPVTRP
jgi:hypothetical protein